MENYRIQINRKLYNTNENLYYTNRKDRILQRLTCHKMIFHMLQIQREVLKGGGGPPVPESLNATVTHRKIVENMPMPPPPGKTFWIRTCISFNTSFRLRKKLIIIYSISLMHRFDQTFNVFLITEKYASMPLLHKLYDQGGIYLF